MQLQAFMEEARIDAEEMLLRLKAAAAAEDPAQDLEQLHVSTIYRHARGSKYPRPHFQDLYEKASQGLIRPEDWLALQRDKSLGMPAKKRRRLEQQQAQQEGAAA